MKPSTREDLNGAAIVWLAQVSKSQDALPFLDSYLDARDQKRAARFRFGDDRARFVMGRALVRNCLARCLSGSDGPIELAQTERGRPIFPRDETIQFSISHTRDWVAFAITANARIGVDLEYVRANLNAMELAPSIFSEADFQKFQTLPPREKSSAFFRAWTRKEAYLKARGEGITDALQQISVSLGPENPALLNDPRDPAASSNWRLHSLALPDDYSGSIACENAQARVEVQTVHFNKGDVIPRVEGI